LLRALTRGRKLAVALGALAAGFLGFETHYARSARAWVHPPRREITPAEREDARRRFPGLEDVLFSSADGVQLRGWYIPSRNGVTVVMGHGLGENRVRFVPDAQFLARHGYGSLLFDWRASGESGGDTATWGDREQLDFAAAVDFVLKRPDALDGRIAAAGFSVGASAVAMAAARDTRVRAVILLAIWTSLDDEIRHKMGRFGLLSAGPVLAELRGAGIDFDAIRPLDNVGRISPRPMLFIGGSNDSDTPVWVMDRVFAAAGEPKRRWTALGAEHGHFQSVDPEGYEKAIVGFLDDAFFPEAVHSSAR
jgi:dipeptidyl aminopeptidase/acylaminoacyl peptidase